MKKSWAAVFWFAAFLLAGCSMTGTRRHAALTGPCANPLYPVLAGATWNYQMTGTFSDAFVRSITSVNGSGFEDQDVFSNGAIRTGKWNCNAGALTALDPVGSTTATVQSSGANSDFQTTGQSGVTLPSSVTAGNPWQQSISMKGKTLKNGLSADSTSDTRVSCSALGMESVTVPAGTFNALHVTCQDSVQINILMQGITINAPALDFTNESWYVPDVGLVKIVSTGSGFNNMISLTSYSLP